ncbi:unnamed protein product [Polarella glacialis]|uniref:Uncharacterized protein n=1 Tax=Polarella glacialis TaxID=89957 RepID=A0A813GUH9_POLGL|nr:unnamed protein product [Polarella glacialis]
MLATASGSLACKGLPLPPAAALYGKENKDLPHANVVRGIRDSELASSYLEKQGVVADAGLEKPLAQRSAGPLFPKGLSREEQERADFERSVAAKPGSGVDLVHAWTEYIQWAADQPDSSDEEARLLARGCAALAIFRQPWQVTHGFGATCAP